MFHLTAEGGKAETLFQNAIIQSPGYSTRDFYNAWNVTLDVATRITDQTITSGLELAALSPEDLREINSIAVYEVGLPTGPYGPLPDSAYVPDWPGALMLRGQFDYTPNIIVGHTANETLSYLPEGIEEVMDLETAIGSLIGPLSEETTNYVLQELYPPPDQTNLYNSAYGRILYLSTDLGFACYARQVSAAYGNETWNYQFDVKPASHSQDLLYHFYGNADSEEAGVDVEAALALQTYWTQLVLKGTVATDHSERPDWKFYGDDKTVLRFVKGGAILAKDDPGAAERCLFWQKVASGEVS
jgi:carboxylesterase type B